jgi:GTP-binding protein Era
VGRPNVGKSTLINGLVGEHVSIVSHHPQTTRDRIVGVVTEGALQLVLLDTPGLHSARNKMGVRMNQEVHGAIDGADVIVFVTDVGPDAKADLSPKDHTVLAGLPQKKPVVLVVNKIDRVKVKADLLPLLAARAGAFDFAAVVPISAKRREGLDRLRREIDKHLPKGERLYDEEQFSDRPARFFVQEYVREQVLRLTREEVPHGVAVTIDRWDESGKIPRIEVTIHVDKPNHKKIVIGQGGSVLKEVGTRARERVEALLGNKVMLKLWVRVTEGWYESDRLMRELGYGSETPS